MFYIELRKRDETFKVEEGVEAIRVWLRYQQSPETRVLQEDGTYKVVDGEVFERKEDADAYLALLEKRVALQQQLDSVRAQMYTLRRQAQEERPVAIKRYRSNKPSSYGKAHSNFLRDGGVEVLKEMEPKKEV